MKKNLTISKLLMLVIMAFLPFSMIAQEGNNKKPVERYWYIQADGGLSIYHGDLANYNGGIWDDFNHFKTMALQPNWDAHFGIGYQFGKVIGLNLKGGYGTYAGHKHNQALVLNSAPDYTRYNLGLDQSNYIEGNLNLTFNLFNMFKYNPRRVINLVPHVGIGGIYYQANAVKHLDGDDNAETPALAEAASKRDLSFTVPAGMEITFNVAPKFDIFLDYTYLFTGTDNLDQVAKIKSEEDKHIINDKDMYSQFNLGLRYKFNNPCNIDNMPDQIEVYAEPDPLVANEDGNVCFKVIVKVPANYFQKQAVLNLKPKFKYDGGVIEVPEPIIMVGEKVKAESGFDFRVPYAEGGEFTKYYDQDHNLCMPYKPEMANCELMGDPMVYVYDGNIYPTHEEIVKNVYYVNGKTQKLADGVRVPDCPKVTNIKKEVKDNVITWTWDADDIVEGFDVAVLLDGKQIKAEKATEKTYSYTMTEAGNYSIEVTSDCKYSTGDKVDGGGENFEPVEIKPDFIYYFDYNKSNIPASNKVPQTLRNQTNDARKAAKNLEAGATVRVEGYASPENGLGTNNQLSKDRTEAAIRDMKAQCKKNAKDIEFKSNGNGSDLPTFYKLVEASNIKDKDIIVRQVKAAPDPEAKVRELKTIYPELEKEILPWIRRAEVFINK